MFRDLLSPFSSSFSSSSCAASCDVGVDDEGPGSEAACGGVTGTLLACKPVKAFASLM